MLLAKKYWTQLYATVVGNFLTLTYGLSLGWPSPTLPLLQSKGTPLERPLTLDEISWIASIYLIGGLVSTPIFGWAANTFGRKKSLLVSAFPQLVSWVIVEFSSTAMHLYFARFLVGFGGTGFYMILPMFVAEISLDE
jgi:MFS family permease